MAEVAVLMNVAPEELPLTWQYRLRDEGHRVQLIEGPLPPLLLPALGTTLAVLLALVMLVIFLLALQAHASGSPTTRERLLMAPLLALACGLLAIWSGSLLVRALRARKRRAQRQWREGVYLASDALLLYAEDRCFLIPRSEIITVERVLEKVGGMGHKTTRVRTGSVSLKLSAASMYEPVKAWLDRAR